MPEARAIGIREARPRVSALLPFHTLDVPQLQLPAPTHEVPEQGRSPSIGCGPGVPALGGKLVDFVDLRSTFS
jgi:hypothetical protein